MYADHARHTRAADRRGASVAGIQIEDGYHRRLVAGVDSAQTHRAVESDDGTREAGDRSSEVASPFAFVIFVDTSVWVEALRSKETPAALHLAELLDAGEAALSAPVRIEILAGASKRDALPLRRVLSAIPLFLPTEETWMRIDDWLERARAAGEHFGFADLLIAAIAADQQASIWSLDSDFARMARIGLVEVH